MNKLLSASLLILLFIFTACSAQRENKSPLPTISFAAKNEIQKPINCSNANNDIQILEQERASVGKQILSGARSVFPIAAVAGMLTGDYSDRIAVASGSYNDAIMMKIDKIKYACNIR